MNTFQYTDFSDPASAEIEKNTARASRVTGPNADGNHNGHLNPSKKTALHHRKKTPS